jgi:hypothetical protein
VIGVQVSKVMFGSSRGMQKIYSSTLSSSCDGRWVKEREGNVPMQSCFRCGRFANEY